MTNKEKQRTWTKVGEKFTRTKGKRAKIGGMLDRMIWHKLPYTMGAMPGMGIKEAIKQLRIPKVSHVAVSHELAPLGLMGIVGHYRDGVAHVYLVDTGVEIIPIATDFYPGQKNPTLRIPVKSRKQLDHLFDAQESLGKAGVTFDTGSNIGNRKVTSRDWELDWSLKGARMENPLFATIGAAAVTGVGLGLGFALVNYGKEKVNKTKNPRSSSVGVPTDMHFPIVDIGQPWMTKQLRNKFRTLIKRGTMIKYDDYTFPIVKTGYAFRKPSMRIQEQKVKESMRSLREGAWQFAPEAQERVATRLMISLRQNNPGAETW